MSQQPYYFQIIPRSIISKTFDKEQGQFRFHVYKTTQQVDFTKQPIKANFSSQNKMKVEGNVKLNFFLPNYFAGKNASAKFIFQLTKKAKYYDEKDVGSYIIDANAYVEEFKRSEKNRYCELWNLSENYSVEVEMFFDESRYLLERLLKQWKDNPAQTFNKPLESKALEVAKQAEAKQEEFYDDQERYNQKRLQLLNKYAGAIVGQGGYRIFDEKQEQEKQRKQLQAKKNQVKKQQAAKNSINQPLKPTQPQKKQAVTPKNAKDEEKPVIKRTESLVIEGENEPEVHGQIKNLKYIIIAIVILILCGSGYFLSKIFLKDDGNGSVQVGSSVGSKVKKSGKKQKAGKAAKAEL